MIHITVANENMRYFFQKKQTKCIPPNIFIAQPESTIKTSPEPVTPNRQLILFAGVTFFSAKQHSTIMIDIQICQTISTKFYVVFILMIVIPLNSRFLKILNSPLLMPSLWSANRNWRKLYSGFRRGLGATPRFRVGSGSFGPDDGPPRHQSRLLA